ncbi:hypothetical protein HDV01_002990 [Terramyces sp. JEL0728]|nr:hypothetical protein HDV01_002990 [Terramyces sp. JEL0728]
MESQPLLPAVHVQRKRSSRFYYLLAVVAAVLVSSLVLSTHIQYDANLPTISEYSKSLPTNQDSYSLMEIDYKGNGLYVESEISFSDISETQIHYDIRSNDPKCMDHLFIKETIEKEKFNLYLETNYENYNPPRIQVYIALHIPKSIHLKDFTGKGGLKWNGPTFSIEKFTAKSSSGSIKIDQLEAGILSAYASSGSIKITKVDVETSIGLHSSSGSITAREITATDLIAHASSGSIHVTLSDIKDSIDLKASSGSVELESDLTDSSLTNQVKIVASSGNVRATVKEYKQLEIQTASGSVELEATPLKQETDATLKTSSGSIRATFFGYEGTFDSTTSSGSLRVNGDVEYDITKSHHKTGQVGTGPGTVKTSSRSGSTSLYFK